MSNKFVFFILCAWYCLCQPACAQDAPPQAERPRIGLVLSGGGVKGAAHVGVLKAIEEAGIPIDYVAGTSVGAVLGGLYAMGYTPAQLDTLVRTLDWDFLLSDKPPRQALSPRQREAEERYLLTIPLSRAGKPDFSGLVRGRNLGNLLARLTVGYHDSIDFDRLPIPFACVATNLVDGREIVLRSGIPAQALRASMAIPGVLKPVDLHGMTLADGGLTNNYPADVARSMGADILIGVTLQRPLDDGTPIQSLPAVISQIVSISCRSKYEENIRMTDLHLGIDVSGVSTMDFTPMAVDTMMRRGWEAARAHWPELMHIRKLCEAGGDTLRPDSARFRRSLSLSEQPVFFVRRVRFESLSPSEERTIRRACRLRDSTEVTQQQIEQAVRLLYEKFLVTDVNYSLADAEGGYDLVFHGRQRGASTVSVGARFDTQDMASLLVGADFVLRTRIPSHLEVNGLLGEQYAAGLGYQVEPALNRQINLFYSYRHRDYDVSLRGKKAYNLSYDQQQAGLGYAFRRLKNFDWEAGAMVQHYHFRDVLAKGDVGLPRLDDDFYYTAFARITYNSQDRTYYPERGTKFHAEYTFTTDDLRHYRTPHAWSALQLSWESVLRLHPHWALLPRVAGRAVWGSDLPYVFSNAIGSVAAGKYLEQQLPFVGIGRIEPTGNKLAVADLRLRYHITGRHYATCWGAAALHAPGFKHFQKGHYRFGGALQYGYYSKFGLIEAMLAYASRCHAPTFYVNVGFDF